MPLFDKDAESIGVRPRNYLEPTFDYYNRTARKDIRKIKEVLESWFASYPESGRSDLRARFRSRIESQHQAAFTELWVHEILRQLECEVQVHPDIGSNTHPDFLVTPKGGKPFLVEVTTTHDSEEEVAAQRRIDQVYDTLNRLKSPDFFLAIIDKGSPVTPVPGARLRGDLELWLKGLSWEEAKKAWDQGGFDAVPTYDWKYENWNVAFQVIPKSEETRGSERVRPIGLTMPLEINLLDTDSEIKRAVELKDRYGEPKLPMILVLGVLGDFCDRFDVMNALFGRETVLFGPGGSRPGGRLHDGAWDGPKGPHHKAISAVWVLHALQTWSAHNPQFWLIHNPWGTYPLSGDVLPFTQYVANLETGNLEEKAGCSIAGVLRLPDPWPPNED
jgi:hypothetical protein